MNTQVAKNIDIKTPSPLIPAPTRTSERAFIS